MTKRDLENYRWMMNALESLGIAYDDRIALRRISMQRLYGVPYDVRIFGV